MVDFGGAVRRLGARLGALMFGRGRGLWVRRGLVFIALALLTLAGAGASYQAVATWLDARAYPPPGQLVDVGGYRMHIYCLGEGSPTVILDALFPGTVSNWVWVQPQIARATRVCAYDRAGLGWSDGGPAPRDAMQHAAELHALLQNADIDGPYVLVGHSLGALSVRMFADRYPQEVAGMVLVEGSDPDAWEQLGLPEGVGVDHRQLVVATLLSRLGVFRLGLISAYGDDADLPEQQRAELRAFFNTAKSLETVRAVDASFSTALDQVRRARGLGAKPLAIVLGSEGDGGQEALRELFVQQAALSTNSVTHVVEGATHAGLVDNEAHATETAAVILRVVEAARRGGPMASISGTP